jgi:hypothetical protein
VYFYELRAGKYSIVKIWNILVIGLSFWLLM